MKGKKFISAFIILIIMFSVTGCGAEVTSLTDEESSMIAEYSANALLNYDVRYKDKLTTTSVISATAEPVVTAAPASVPVQSAAPSTGVDTNAIANNNTLATPVATPQTAATPADTTANVDLNTLYGQDNLTFSIHDYELCDSYSEKSNGIQMIANDGEQLLILKMKIQNNSDKSQRITLMNKEIFYKLQVNGAAAFTPKISLLSKNGLQLINAKIPAQKSENAIIVFSIPKEAQINSLDLFVTKDDKKAVIKVK